jgi:hypothetical protein
VDVQNGEQELQPAPMLSAANYRSMAARSAGTAAAAAGDGASPFPSSSPGASYRLLPDVGCLRAAKPISSPTARTMLRSASAISRSASFLAVGTPNAEPPVVLLSDVSMSPTSELISLSILALGTAGVVVARRCWARS